MKKATKRAILTLGIMFLFCFMVGSAQAAGQEDNSFVKFWRGVFQWPFNAAKDSAQAVGETGVKAAETVAQEGKDIGGALTGDKEAAKNLVVNPITGTAETVKTGVVGVGEMPGKATEESWPSENK